MSLPTVKCQEAEEVELVDPQTTLKEKCGKEPKCASFKQEWETCEARVRSRKKTTEECTEELIDFVNCVDHCVAPELFKHLK